MVGTAGRASPDSAAWWHVRHWPVWTLPPAALALWLGVVVTAYGATLAALVRCGWPTGADLAVAIALIGVGVVHSEIVIGWENTRNTTKDHQRAHTDFTSVWTFAAALLLTPPVSVLAAVLIHLHLCLRLGLSGNCRYRQVYSNSMVAWASLAATGVVAAAGGRAVLTEGGVLQVVALGGAMVTYAGVGSFLLIVVKALSTRTRIGGPRTWPGDDRLEIVTVAIGALAAFIIADHQAAMLVFLMPVVLVLQRTITAYELDQRAGTDPLTGLANGAAWDRAARRALGEAARRQLPGGLLLIDIDRLEAGPGTPIGDRVLAAVSGEVAASVREQDLLGHFGGNILAVLLPEVEDLLPIAHAMADQVTRLQIPTQRAGEAPGDDVEQVAVSIGGARWPQDGSSLHELLWAADVALQRARRQPDDPVIVSRNSMPSGSGAVDYWARTARPAPRAPERRSRTGSRSSSSHPD